MPAQQLYLLFIHVSVCIWNLLGWPNNSEDYYEKKLSSLLGQPNNFILWSRDTRICWADLTNPTEYFFENLFSWILLGQPNTCFRIHMRICWADRTNPAEFFWKFIFTDFVRPAQQLYLLFIHVFVCIWNLLGWPNNSEDYYEKKIVKFVRPAQQFYSMI